MAGVLDTIVIKVKGEPIDLAQGVPIELQPTVKVSSAATCDQW